MYVIAFNLNKIRILFILFCTIILSLTGTGQQVSQEYLVKAGFIERLTRFIEFPDSVLSSDTSQVFLITVLGNDPFNGLLETFFRQVKIKKHPVEINYSNSITETNGSHIIFISDSFDNDLVDLIEHTRNKAVITIGDTKTYGDRGVLINFFLKQNKLRFEINRKSMESSKLKFSHLLLSSASIIE